VEFVKDRQPGDNSPQMIQLLAPALNEACQAMEAGDYVTIIDLIQYRFEPILESGTQEMRKLRPTTSDSGKKILMNDKELTGKIIAAAIAVHRELGPGFLESIYEEALCIELDLLKVPYERQKPIAIIYRAKIVGEPRLDLLVAHTVVVELKAIKALENIHFATVRSYMKATQAGSGLLLNFASMPLTVKRVGREFFQGNAGTCDD
jgi:GxxExxY protein